MIAAGRPPLHLWVYNHPLSGIGDQLVFFWLLMKQQGYRVTMSRRPRLDALNVIIENFSEDSSQTLIEFCERTGKRVAIIMTEHLDLSDDELLIHGLPLRNKNDYMAPETQLMRIKNLMDCAPWLRAIFTLGDLPELKGSALMFPGIPVRTLPFPALHRIAVAAETPQNDFAFSGGSTVFRTRILQKVAASHSLIQTTQYPSRKRRDQINASARIVLNVPQRLGWRWLSPMRIIAALNCGRATVSIATEDTSWISRCCLQLPGPDWPWRLAEARNNWIGEYLTASERYESMRLDFLAERGFPTDLFEYWSLLERSSLKYD